MHMMKVVLARLWHMGLAAQLLGDKCGNLFCLVRARGRCRRIRGPLGMSAILAAAAFHSVTRSHNCV